MDAIVPARTPSLAMQPLTNPFESIYIAELIPASQFPSLFSPRLIPKVRELYQPGNVVLQGTQGTGKTMLLSLLRADIRAAYWAHGAETFPCDKYANPFVGASINFTNSGIRGFTQLRFHAEAAQNQRLCQTAFADFTGCWLLRDLLEGLSVLWNSNSERSKSDLGLNVQPKRLDAVARDLSKIWELPSTVAIRDIEGLREHIENRLRSYTRFLSFKSSLEELQSTLSTAVPITDLMGAAADQLRTHDVMPERVHLFLALDQFEELEIQTRYQENSERFLWFREVVDQTLSTRNAKVSYRVGSRTYAWGRSEHLREYVMIDVDERLRRHEHEPNDVFPKLLEDILKRRLKVSRYTYPKSSSSLLKDVFGRSLDHRQKAKRCVRTNSHRVIKPDSLWPKSIKAFLFELAETDVLSAKLGEVWTRQQAGHEDAVESLGSFEEPLSDAKPPWELPKWRWWAKERKPLAVLQIAAANGQRVPYFGYSDIVELSGRNTLVFATICREVWTEWLSRLPSDAAPRIDEPFSQTIQANAIRSAAVQWYEKLPANPNGDTLLAVIKVIAQRLWKQLQGDRTMSYPGANGFSLKSDELKDDFAIQRLLSDITATGNLQRFPHTSKNRKSGVREKWYLLPILGAYFGLTIPRTKEPKYLSVAEFRKWLSAAKVEVPGLPPRRSKTPLPSKQKTLFE